MAWAWKKTSRRGEGEETGREGSSESEREGDNDDDDDKVRWGIGGVHQGGGGVRGEAKQYEGPVCSGETYEQS